MERKTVLTAAGFLAVLGLLAAAIAVPVANKNSRKATDDADLQKANFLLDEEPVFDGHNDWPYSLRNSFNNSINDVNLDSDLTQLYSGSHTDLPRGRLGKLGAQFWSAFVSCQSDQKDAVRRALQQIDVIKRMVDLYPEEMAFVRTAQEVDDAQAQGKLASTIGLEGGHMIDSSLAVLRLFFELGVRYMTLTHSCDIQWATAWNTKTTGTGLSDFGERVVLEMNRLGMLVDLAHVSDETMRDVFRITKAPVIYSHSSLRHFCDTQRNVPDDILLLLKENRGVIMINFYNNYITCTNNATVSNVADHFDHVKEVIGVDYVGMGGDYDGVPRMPVKLEDVSKYPNIVAELLSRGWSEEDVKKATGANVKRVMREAEKVAADLQKLVKPDETWIDSQFLDPTCRRNV